MQANRTIPDPSKMSLRERLQELNTTSSREAAILIARGEHVGFYRLVWAPICVFLRVYLRQGGWHRGVAGLISAFFSAYELIVRYMKVWEHQHTENLPPPSRRV